MIGVRVHADIVATRGDGTIVIRVPDTSTSAPTNGDIDERACGSIA